MASPSLDAEIDAWLRGQHGVITRENLLSLGLARRQADAVADARRFIALRRGVYISPSHPRSRLQTMTAVCLAHPEVSIAFTTAGAEWGYRGMTWDQRIHVLAPHDVQIDVPGIVLHRCRRIDPIDLAGRRPDGIVLTSPPRTLFDAASIIGGRRTSSAIEQALAQQRCTLATLASTSRRLGHPRRPGSKVFQEVLSSRPEWRRAARSDLEVAVLLGLAERGLPDPVVNMPFVLLDGSSIEIDLAWPGWTVAYEVDHPFWHDGTLESRRDKKRDRLLGAMGWLPQRLTQADIDENLDTALDDVARSLRARGWDGTTAA